MESRTCVQLWVSKNNYSLNLHYTITGEPKGDLLRLRNLYAASLCVSTTHCADDFIDFGSKCMFVCASAMTDVYWWWLEECIWQLNWQKTFDCRHTCECSSITYTPGRAFCIHMRLSVRCCEWAKNLLASCHNENSYMAENRHCIFIEAHVKRNHEKESKSFYVYGRMIVVLCVDNGLWLSADEHRRSVFTELWVCLELFILIISI